MPCDAKCRALDAERKSVGRRTAVRQGQLAAPVLWAAAALAMPSKASTRMLSVGGVQRSGRTSSLFEVPHVLKVRGAAETYRV